MNSLFSKAMDYHVEAQFRKDPSGRLVFLPTGVRGKAYFVDSQSDEDKIRSFLKMYRSAFAIVSLLVFPSIYLPGFVLNFCRMPLRSKLETNAGTTTFFLLLFGALMFLLWSVYKETVPGFTASLSEVGPDRKGQLSEISPQPRRVQRLALVVLGVSTLLLGLMVLAVWLHFRR